MIDVVIVSLLAIAIVWSFVLCFRRGWRRSNAPTSLAGKLLLGVVCLAVGILGFWFAILALSGKA